MATPIPAAAKDEDREGPLPLLLLILTFVTGLVDAVSYLNLGHVFVANMTGNIVFLGFALAGAEGFSAPASLAALAGFLVGALAAGRLGSSTGQHRGRFLAIAVLVKILLVVAALVVAMIIANPDSQLVQYALIILLALAMGVQNATARRLAVPDLTTTVLTLTLTGLAADSTFAGGNNPRPVRRLLATAAMLWARPSGLMSFSIVESLLFSS
jgi:uncharacterized membrane protein YoaK (UPF0700 family)